jgi:hypothetical protein
MVTNELDGLEAGLRAVGLFEREVAATKLAAAGREGGRVLAAVATDRGAATAVRVTALRHLPADDEAVDALRELLGDALPVIRVVALDKVEAARALALAPLVEALTRDPATMWDLDEEIAVARVAARVLASLSPRPLPPALRRAPAPPRRRFEGASGQSGAALTLRSARPRHPALRPGPTRLFVRVPHCVAR